MDLVTFLLGSGDLLNKAIPRLSAVCEPGQTTSTMKYISFKGRIFGWFGMMA